MKIAYIMLTNGLEYDDRIRKEMFSMRELLGDVEFKIFGFHGDNNAEQGMLSYGVPYELVSLHNRGTGNGLISNLKKEYDLYRQIKPKVKDYDLLWICDEHPMIFPFLSNKPMIFDLHEIPTFRGSWYKNLAFHRMERRCRWLIHANHERLDYLLNTNVLTKPKKNLVLRNYPDQNWIAEGNNLPDSFMQFKKWLGDDDYVYIQGINSEARHAWETLSAIMEAKCIKAVVIGSVPAEVKERVQNTYPESSAYIYYTGQVVQSETAAFIAHCKFTIVFYNINRVNNRYCEPNRLFQCLAFGKPAVVGCNESMASVINKYGNGIVLGSDGGDVGDTVEGLKLLMKNFDELKEKAMSVKDNFSWEAQMPVFKTLFNK